MVCGNVLFLRRSRPLWAVVCFNLLLCLIWAPLLARTLDRSYPILIWLLVSGLPIALTAATNGLVLCCTVVGIPWGLQCFKMAKLALMPFGADIIHT